MKLKKQFIFTKSRNREQTLPAFRTAPPNSLLDRWVKCHLRGSHVVLGSAKDTHTDIIIPCECEQCGFEAIMQFGADETPEYCPSCGRDGYGVRAGEPTEPPDETIRSTK